jgi:protein involved in polysaccharide export with SLBB domain
MSIWRKRRWFALVWSIWVVVGLSAQPSAEATADDPEVTQMALLDDKRAMQVGDYLVYQVLEEQEPAVILFVDDRGMLDIPLLDPVPAEGATCKQLAFRIKEQLEKSFFYRATVLLRFQNANNSRGRIRVMGRVARPGPLDIPADEILTVSMALVRAGSSLVGADLSQVEVLRTAGTEDGEQERITVDVRDVFENGNLAADRVVRPGDVIVVPEAQDASARFMITGMVGKEGFYRLPADGSPLMLSEAILNAGGFQQWARANRVKVIRKDPENPEREQTLEVDVEAILEGRKRDTDIEVKPGDFIRVEEKFFSFQ